MIPAMLVVAGLVGVLGTVVTARSKGDTIRTRASMIGFWTGAGVAGLADPAAVPFDIIWILLACLSAGSGAGFAFTPMADPARVSLAMRDVEGREVDAGTELDRLRAAAPSMQEWLVVGFYAAGAAALLIGGGMLGEWWAVSFGILGLVGSLVTLVRFGRFSAEVSSRRRRLGTH